MKAYADEESFGSFLKEQRTKKEVSLEQLAEGLCSVSGLARIEKGERTAGKAVRDRLLYRLGISPDIYEQFLFAEDYINWKKRQQLLYAVSREDTANARRLLGEYREKYVAGREKGAERRLEQQFCLALEAQILQSEAASRTEEAASGTEEAAGRHKEVQEKLGNLYREALGLTVILPEPGKAGEKAYSVQELNLILETVH